MASGSNCFTCFLLLVAWCLTNTFFGLYFRVIANISFKKLALVAVLNLGLYKNLKSDKSVFFIFKVSTKQYHVIQYMYNVLGVYKGRL